MSAQDFDPDADPRESQWTPNPAFDPGRDGGDAELVLNVMKTDIWPSIAPDRVVKRTNGELNKFEVHEALSSLADAGWVTKRDRGFYDLIADPRDDEPMWPVDWDNRDILPDPLPSEPPNRIHAFTVHEQYRERINRNADAPATSD